MRGRKTLLFVLAPFYLIGTALCDTQTPTLLYIRIDDRLLSDTIIASQIYKMSSYIYIYIKVPCGPKFITLPRLLYISVQRIAFSATSPSPPTTTPGKWYARKYLVESRLRTAKWSNEGRIASKSEIVLANGGKCKGRLSDALMMGGVIELRVYLMGLPRIATQLCEEKNVYSYTDAFHSASLVFVSKPIRTESRAQTTTVL